MAERYRLREVDPSTLKNHPLNIQIYGGDVDQSFIDDVKRRGVLEPVLATLENVIVAGHRRRVASIKNGLKKIPVLYDAALVDENDIAEAVIRSNRETRDRTVEQQAREYDSLLAIEEARAAARKAAAQFKKAGGKNGQPADGTNLSPPQKPGEKGKAEAKAAAGAGMKRTTARKARTVVKKIDELKSEGKADEAKHLAETLNKGSVDAAVKEATGSPVPRSEREEGIIDRFETIVPHDAVQAFQFAESDVLSKALHAISNAKTHVNAIPDGPGTEIMGRQRILDALEDARRLLKFGVPFAVCPYCTAPNPPKKAKKDPCSACGDRHWVTEEIFKGTPAELKPEKAKAKVSGRGKK